MDNLIFAAALGDLPLVERYLRDPGAGSARIGVHGPVLNPPDMVGYAVIYAAASDRQDVIELLLARDPDLDLTEPVFGATALGAARYHGHAGIEALLAPD